MEEVKDISPWAAALMTAGGNILANNRPGVSYGSAIGSGISSFAPAFYATKGAQDRQKYIDTLQKYKQLEFDAEQQKAQQEAAQKARFNSAIQSGEAFQGMPQDQVETINRAYKIGGDELARKVFETYSTREPKTPTPFELYLKGDPRGAAWNTMSTPKTTVSVGGPTYAAAQKNLWESLGDEGTKQFTNSKAQYEQAAGLHNLFSSINEALDGYETGALEEGKLKLARAASAVGLEVDKEKLGNYEYAQSLANQVALKARDPNGPFGGIPGNLNPQELELIKSIGPSILMNRGARLALQEVTGAALARAQETYTAQRNYLNEKVSAGQPVNPVEFMDLGVQAQMKGYGQQRKQPIRVDGETPGGEQKQRFVFDPETGELVPK